MIVKRRDKNLFDESNTEEQNVWLLNLLEKVFATEAQITQFLDHPNEQYCSYLSQYLATMKSQLTALPDYAKLHQKILPNIVSQILNTTKVIFCPLDQIPHDIIEPGVDFLVIDDAHLISEPAMYQALRLYPKRLILSGAFITQNRQD